MKSKSSTIALVVVALALMLGIGESLKLLCGQRYISVSSFPYATPNMHMTEEVALIYANKALSLSPPRGERWVPVLGNTSTPDRYLSRNPANENVGYITFRSTDADPKGIYIERVVDIKIEGDIVKCAVRGSK
jgi:hypothetical protein